MRLSLPLFILFEGIDGSGKSTLRDIIFSYYKSIGIPVVKLKEPTDGEWGKKIREMLRGEVLPAAHEQLRLFLLDREDDVKRNILPALKGQKMIIMDRYYYSNAAYQGAFDLSPESILAQNRSKGFPEPSRVYLFDIDPEVALQRIVDRNNIGGREIYERKLFLDRVQEIYLSIADDNFYIVDGRRTIDEIFHLITEDIVKNFSK